VNEYSGCLAKVIANVAAYHTRQSAKLLALEELYTVSIVNLPSTKYEGPAVQLSELKSKYVLVARLCLPFTYRRAERVFVPL
jgi:hypothetical protein